MNDEQQVQDAREDGPEPGEPWFPSRAPGDEAPPVLPTVNTNPDIVPVYDSRDGITPDAAAQAGDVRLRDAIDANGGTASE